MKVDVFFGGLYSVGSWFFTALEVVESLIIIVHLHVVVLCEYSFSSEEDDTYPIEAPGQNDPITTTSISDFHKKLNTNDCTTKLQLFAKVILHNPNSHTFNSYQYNEHDEIVLKYNLTDAPIFS